MTLNVRVWIGERCSHNPYTEDQYLTDIVNTLSGFDKTFKKRSIGPIINLRGVTVDNVLKWTNFDEKKPNESDKRHDLIVKVAKERAQEFIDTVHPKEWCSAIFNPLAKRGAWQEEPFWYMRYSLEKKGQIGPAKLNPA